MSTKMTPQLRFPEFTDEWQVKKLGDIAEFSKGSSISKNDIHEDGKIEAIRYGELYTTYSEVIDEVQSRTNLSPNGLKFSKANDVIVPASGETAIDIATASCVLRDNIALSGDLNIIRTHNDGVFMAYYLNNKKKNDIARLAQGVSVIHLYSSNLKDLEVNLPSKPEQEKIADFLTAVDDRIAVSEKKLELLETYKRGVMQKIFSQQVRFKDDNGNPYPDWEEKKLKHVLKIRGERNSKNETNEVFSVAKNAGVINQIEHLGRSFASKEISNYKVVRPGDIIYTKSPTSDFPYGIIKQNMTNRTGVVSVLYGVYVPVNIYIGRILDEYFKSWQNTYNYLNPIVQKGAKNTINIGDAGFLEGRTMHLPVSEDEQQKIANFFTTLDEKITAEKSKLTATRQFKKALLQRMFV